jgi:hypothetical protein
MEYAIANAPDDPERPIRQAASVSLGPTSGRFGRV